MIALVLGYGCHLDRRLRRYLDGAARELLRQPVSAVVTSGGYTAARSAPGVSEAQLMADYLRERGVAGPFIIEDGARTTLQNFRNSAAELRHRGLAPRRALVFCDGVRVAKVRLLARRFLPDVALTLHTADFERSALQGLVQRTLAVAHDTALLRWPLLERLSLAVVTARQSRA